MTNVAAFLLGLFTAYAASGVVVAAILISRALRSRNPAPDVRPAADQAPREQPITKPGA
jgi:hypothetical protein